MMVSGVARPSVAAARAVNNYTVALIAQMRRSVQEYELDLKGQLMTAKYTKRRFIPF
jgi:hypothetical protein